MVKQWMIRLKQKRMLFQEMFVFGQQFGNVLWSGCLCYSTYIKETVVHHVGTSIATTQSEEEKKGKSWWWTQRISELGSLVARW
jgi:hypothetical protein